MVLKQLVKYLEKYKVKALLQIYGRLYLVLNCPLAFLWYYTSMPCWHRLSHVSWFGQWNVNRSGIGHILREAQCATAWFSQNSVPPAGDRDAGSSFGLGPKVRNKYMLLQATEVLGSFVTMNNLNKSWVIIETERWNVKKKLRSLQRKNTHECLYNLLNITWKNNIEMKPFKAVTPWNVEIYFLHNSQLTTNWENLCATYMSKDSYAKSS